jgi:GT2 family glycosyltransferase
VRLAILIPVFNHLDETAHCVDRVRRCRSVPSRIVVLDDGSTDDTPGWCAAQNDVDTVRLPHRGFTATVNAGIRRALRAGEVPVVLNNDTDGSRRQRHLRLRASPVLSAGRVH